MQYIDYTQQQGRTSKDKTIPSQLEQKNGYQPQPTCRPQSRLKGFGVRLDFAAKDFTDQ